MKNYLARIDELLEKQAKKLEDFAKKITGESENEKEIIKSCAGTKELNKNTGTEHKLIQNDYLTKYDDAQREYYIPETSGGLPDNEGRADIVTIDEYGEEGNIYELKYFNATEIANGIVQLGRYVPKANEHCDRAKEWKRGDRPYAAIFWRAGRHKVKQGNDVIAYLLQPGLIIYFDNDGTKYLEPEKVFQGVKKNRPNDIPTDDRVTELLKKEVLKRYPELEPLPNVIIDTNILWDLLWDLGISIGIIIMVITAVAAAIVAGAGLGAVVTIFIAAGLTIPQIEKLLGRKIDQYIQ